MIRLVKGAYDPPEGAGYRETEAVAEAYEARLEQLVRTFDGPDQGVAVGTHDRGLIERARALGAEHGVDIQVQLLMGVREDLQAELARELDVWQYVPYGGDWVAYFSRRLAERRGNVRFALRALLGG
jgi:proline dehydrogenase